MTKELRVISRDELGGERCQECSDVGYYSTWGMDGEEEQNQCQFCYENPSSVFNRNNQFSKLPLLSDVVAVAEALINILGYGTQEYPDCGGSKKGITPHSPSCVYYIARNLLSQLGGG